LKGKIEYEVELNATIEISRDIPAGDALSAVRDCIEPLSAVASLDRQILDPDWFLPTLL